MTLAARVKHVLDWLIAHAVLTPARPGQQTAAIRYFPDAADERRVQSDLYGRCTHRAPKKRASAVDTARSVNHEELSHGRTR